MEFTKEQLNEFKNDPLMNFFANMLGTSMEDLLKEVEKEKKYYTEPITEVKTTPKENACNNIKSEDAEIGEKIKNFFNKLVENGEASMTIENGHPHYKIKEDEHYADPGSPEELIEDDETSFSMSKEDLKEFVKNYMNLENTFRKIEHTYGIDLNANGNSIYSQYNNIVWNLIENIFGEDNREDIADFCFGNSNFDTIEDLYEELV